MDYEKVAEKFGWGYRFPDGRFDWCDGDFTDMLAYVRREALEEAAKLCDGLECPPFADNEWGEGAHACAEAIRALISPEPS
jgi:hypothetical protein